MDIIFEGHHTEVLERFRKHAAAKLAKVEKFDHRTIRVEVEITCEHNPRQAGQKERVQLTVVSRGPIVRAEASAADRYAALDMALAKLESQLRRALDRRKGRHGGHEAVRLGDLPEAYLVSDAELPAIRLGAGGGLLANNNGPEAMARMAAAADEADAAEAAAPPEPEDVVPVEMEGDGPLLVREKFHAAVPMAIDQALFEMELVGHDFFLFTDEKSHLPSVVYRRRGYQYGVIRLVDELDDGSVGASASAGSVAASRDAGGSGTTGASGASGAAGSAADARLDAPASGRAAPSTLTPSPRPSAAMRPGARAAGS